MVSKREKRKWRKYLASETMILEAHLTSLMVQELKFDQKLRKKALQMAKKRKINYVC